MRARTFLTTGLLAALGCGTSAPAPAPPPTAATTPPTEPDATSAPAPAPEPPKVRHELDPAKHGIPDRPVSGEIAGEPFAPVATITGRQLAFLLPGVDDKPGRSVTLTLPGDGATFVVRETDPAGKVPVVEIGGPSGAQIWENGYALTLELGPASGSTRPGKVYLSLTDTARGYFAGTFTAAVVRAIDERPGAADAPFIEGKVARAAGVLGAVKVSYLGVLADGSIVTDEIAGSADTPAPDRPSHTYASPFPPRYAAYVRAAGGDRYEFTHLPPGRYLVAARPDAGGGPAAWTTVDLSANGRLDVPLKLDPADQGSVTVKLPAGVTDPVTLLPADPKPNPAVTDDILGHTFKYQEPTKDGTATFKAVAPGTYRAVAGGKTASVTVTAGKPATVEVK